MSQAGLGKIESKKGVKKVDRYLLPSSEKSDGESWRRGGAPETIIDAEADIPSTPACICTTIASISDDEVSGEHNVEIETFSQMWR